MREALSKQRVDRFGRSPTTSPMPQWEGLFLAPSYGSDEEEAHEAEEIEPDWQDGAAAAPPVPRRRRGGRRAA